MNKRFDNQLSYILFCCSPPNQQRIFQIQHLKMIAALNTTIFSNFDRFYDLMHKYFVASSEMMIAGNRFFLELLGLGTSCLRFSTSKIVLMP